MINVNTKACDCQYPLGHGAYGHSPNCAAKPVLLSCPIPRSVTFTVRLGECTCISEPPCSCGASDDGYPHAHGCSGRVHPLTCSASPIRVTCSISGKTWEESEVDEAEEHGGQSIDGGPQDAMHHGALLSACRDRWALVKALVLGKFAHRDVGDAGPGTPEALIKHRDAVYAALADMARAEDLHADAYSRAWQAMGKGTSSPERRSAHWVLVRYVDHLIDQVGRL